MPLESFTEQDVKCQLAGTERDHVLREHLEAHWDGYIDVMMSWPSSMASRFSARKCCDAI